MFYTFIWNFCPELIKDGYVYSVEAPLYKIVTTKGYKYLKNDEELEKYRNENKGKKYEVKRMKGLGEMSAEETEEALLDADTRTLVQLTIDDVVKTDILFDQLMGTGAAARKAFIKAHSQEATYEV